MSWHIFDATVRMGMDVTLGVCIAAMLRAGHRNGMRRVAAIKRAELRKTQGHQMPENVISISVRAPRGAA